MEAMPRPRWPHLLREVSRHGTVSWVVRIGHGPRIAIREPYGTTEFERSYHAALLGEGPQRPRLRRDKSSLEWLIARYQASSAWLSFAKGTRRLRQGIFKHIIEAAGDMPYREVTAAMIRDGRERRKGTPNQANAFIIVMRALFSWAVEQEFMDNDPTEGVKTLKLSYTGGFKEAIEEDIAKFEACWPKGSREYLALTVFLENGLEAWRRSESWASACEKWSNRNQDREDRPVSSNTDFGQTRPGDRGDANLGTRAHLSARATEGRRRPTCRHRPDGG